MRKLLTATLILFPLIAVAQPSPAPEAPPPPSQSNAGNSDEAGGFDPGGAEIRIITEGDKIIEEFSLNGRVYMVRIQQKGFPPYYLIDRDGDGRMDEQVSELMGPSMPPPNWELFRW
jgi:hypothetical protein